MHDSTLIQINWLEELTLLKLKLNRFEITAKKQLPHDWAIWPPWVKQINTIFQAFQVENSLKPKEHIYKQN